MKDINYDKEKLFKDYPEYSPQYKEHIKKITEHIKKIILQKSPKLGKNENK